MKTATLPIVTCPECGCAMVLRTTLKFFYPNGQPRKFWGCSDFPRCKSAHGAHPDGRPMGTPADGPTKTARIRAHASFDVLWRRELGGFMRRGDAYGLMQHVMGLGVDQSHIGLFGIAECELLIERLAAFFDYKSVDPFVKAEGGIS